MHERKITEISETKCMEMRGNGLMKGNEEEYICVGFESS